MTGRASFGGRSALRSWLTAVLKHKIVDVIRQRVRYDSLDSAGGDEEAMEIRSDWAGPDALAEQRQQLQHTLERIEVLPQGAARCDAVSGTCRRKSSEEVCERLNITESSLFVRLHRAHEAIAVLRQAGPAQRKASVRGRWGENDLCRGRAVSLRDRCSPVNVGLTRSRLIAWHWQPDHETPLLLLGNRDEFYARPTQSLRGGVMRRCWPGRDLQAGGADGGVNRRGQLAASPTTPRSDEFS